MKSMKQQQQQQSSFLARYGARLLANGYPIVPIRAGTKFPGYKGWQRTQASRQRLEGWLANGFAKGGVGVLCQRFPGVDLDVQDKGIVDKLVRWCERHIGQTVRRVGQAPKCLLAYRADEPFTKLASNRYAGPDGPEHRVEILGDGQQFVAYAIHPDTGRPYEWVSGRGLADVAADDLPVITRDQAQALIDYFERIVPDSWTLKEREASPAGTPAGDALPAAERALANARPRLDVTTEELEEALSCLDPDMGNDAWVRVGMALYHQYDGSDEGFALWDRWSAAGVKYRRSEMRTRWKSFNVDLRSRPPITAATILRQAKGAKRQNHGNGDPLNRFVDRYVYVEDGDRVCDLKRPPHTKLLKLSEFRNATANILRTVPAPTIKDPDRVKREPVHVGWLAHPDRKTAAGEAYEPGRRERLFRDEYGMSWINRFHLPPHRKTGADTSIFFNHMDYLFPVKTEREWFIDWMAFNIQFPQRRCKVTPLHISVPHGTGRGWVVELLGHLLGPWNCTKTTMRVLTGEGNGGAFQDYLNESLFCAVEEVREGKRRYSVSDRIRDVLESPRLEVNTKFGGKKTQTVFTNFFLMSNHPDALVIGEEDRRINVLSGPGAPRDSRYYTRLYEWLETDGVAALYHGLRARDLTGFNWQRSMKTESRTEMISNNRTETEELFFQFLEEPPFPAMTFTQIKRALTGLSEKDYMDVDVDEGQLLKLLQHHAWHSGRMSFGGRNGAVRRAWVFDQKLKTDTKAIRESVEACGL